MCMQHKWPVEVSTDFLFRGTKKKSEDVLHNKDGTHMLFVNFTTAAENESLVSRKGGCSPGNKMPFLTQYQTALRQPLAASDQN